MSNFRMLPYECDPATGACAGGFGGGGPAGYSWGVVNVPYFGGYTGGNDPYIEQPETPILTYQPLPGDPKTWDTPVSTPGDPKWPIVIWEPGPTQTQPKVATPQTPISTLAPQEPGPLVATVTPGGQVVVSHTPQTQQAEVAGIPLLWIGVGLLALFLLNK